MDDYQFRSNSRENYKYAKAGVAEIPEPEAAEPRYPYISPAPYRGNVYRDRPVSVENYSPQQPPPENYERNFVRNAAFPVRDNYDNQSLKNSRRDDFNDYDNDYDPNAYYEEHEPIVMPLGLVSREYNNGENRHRPPSYSDHQGPITELKIKRDEEQRSRERQLALEQHVFDQTPITQLKIKRDVEPRREVDFKMPPPLTFDDTPVKPLKYNPFTDNSYAPVQEYKYVPADEVPLPLPVPEPEAPTKKKKTIYSFRNRKQPEPPREDPLTIPESTVGPKGTSFEIPLNDVLKTYVAPKKIPKELTEDKNKVEEKKKTEVIRYKVKPPPPQPEVRKYTGKSNNTSPRKPVNVHTAQQPEQLYQYVDPNQLQFYDPSQVQYIDPLYQDNQYLPADPNLQYIDPNQYFDQNGQYPVQYQYIDPNYPYSDPNYYIDPTQAPPADFVDGVKYEYRYQMVPNPNYKEPEVIIPAQLPPPEHQKQPQAQTLINTRYLIIQQKGNEGLKNIPTSALNAPRRLAVDTPQTQPQVYQPPQQQQPQVIQFVPPQQQPQVFQFAPPQQQLQPQIIQFPPIQQQQPQIIQVQDPLQPQNVQYVQLPPVQQQPQILQLPDQQAPQILQFPAVSPKPHIQSPQRALPAYSPVMMKKEQNNTNKKPVRAFYESPREPVYGSPVQMIQRRQSIPSASAVTIIQAPPKKPREINYEVVKQKKPSRTIVHHYFK